MYKNVIFVNKCGVKVIDELHLIKKLKNGKLFFSVLKDIGNAPNINNELIKLKNVIMTNNGASMSLEGGQSIGNDLFMQVKNMYKNTI